jgi:UDP-N-acetylglucosamine--N-acetylmuramyl-(pentapeptide) pyrophosphoryl-undecaprenol N-acetylglucosamine transferase
MSDHKLDVVFTCGGTGGHVYPAIALAQVLEGQYSFTFFGSENRQDRLILPRYGYSFESIASSSRNVWVIATAFFKARRLLMQYFPKVLVSSGGYHTFPVVLAAKWLGIPILLLEQNVLPGKVNRIMARFADHICVSFAQTKRYFKHGDVVLTGNPLRQNYLDDALSESFKKHLPLTSNVLLVVGGSQGASALNECIEALYSKFQGSDDWTLIHLTGKDYFDEHYGEVPYKVVLNSFGRESLFIFPYFENMKLLYSLATFVVGRAGATTLSELLDVQKQCLLVPYPYAADNHQVLNAKVIERAGLGHLVMEDELTPTKVWELAQASVGKSRDIKPVVDATQKILSILKRYM